jgi:hypothetical protein
MFRLVLTRLIAARTASAAARQTIEQRCRQVSSHSDDDASRVRVPLGSIHEGDASSRMGIQFRCQICDHTLQKTFTRQSYEHGVVLIRCDSCENLHLIADNLGWFKDLTDNGKFK